jgi:hypothetical protein
MEEHRPMAFENRVPRRIFGPKTERSFILCTDPQILFGRSSKGE